MEGRFRKVQVSNLHFVGGGGVHCNNPNASLMLQIMKMKFGKPNGNSLRTDESTWKYVFEYRGTYLTVYDYGDSWSIGFLELDRKVPDYELIFAVSKMLFDFLKSEVEKVEIELQTKEVVLT